MRSETCGDARAVMVHGCYPDGPGSEAVKLSVVDGPSLVFADEATVVQEVEKSSSNQKVC